MAKIGKIKVCFYVANQARSVTVDSVPHQEIAALYPVPEKALVENSVSQQVGYADNLQTFKRLFEDLTN